MNLSPETVAAFNNPPPRKYMNVRDAHGEIQRLESERGIDHREMIFNITQATERLKVLRAIPIQSAANTSAPAQTATPDIIVQYQAVSRPEDRVRFYRKNKEAIDAVYRDAPPPKQGHSMPTGNKLIDELNALNGAEFVKFYRANSEAIAAEYQKLNT